MVEGVPLGVPLDVDGVDSITIKEIATVMQREIGLAGGVPLKKKKRGGDKLRLSRTSAGLATTRVLASTSTWPPYMFHVGLELDARVAVRVDVGVDACVRTRAPVLSIFFTLPFHSEFQIHPKSSDTSDPSLLARS